jgi:ATP phosphoribosyltransferase
MLATNGRLKLALQKSGRLTDDSLSLLRSCGLEFEFQKNSLYSPSRNFELDILALRDDDIPEYVQDGVADLGIVGENVVTERKARVKILNRLRFGACRLIISVPARSSVRLIRDLKGKRIATTYPNTLKQFLRSRPDRPATSEATPASEKKNEGRRSRHLSKRYTSENTRCRMIPTRQHSLLAAHPTFHKRWVKKRWR